MAPPVEDGYISEFTQNGNKTVTNGDLSSEFNDQIESSQGALLKEPLQLSGVLDQYKSFNVTPVIGKEFPDASLAEWLRAPNSDDLIRELAITS